MDDNFREHIEKVADHLDRGQLEAAQKYVLQVLKAAWSQTMNPQLEDELREAVEEMGLNFW